MKKKLLILLTMQICNANDIKLVPFFSSMSKSINFSMQEFFGQEEWQIVMALYTTFKTSPDAYYQSQPRIPKIIHQIWLGSPLPLMCEFLSRSWKKYHPDWEYRLWTEKEIEEFGLLNKELYDISQNYGEKADMARYEILYRIGGLYIDTDFECIRAFDMLHHCLDFYTGLGYSREAAVWNGIIGCSPGHPIMQKCIESIKKVAVDDNEIFVTTGPLLFTKCFFEVLPFLKVDKPIVAFPVSYFYPWPNYKRFEQERVPALHLEEESLALHYWHTSWLKK